MPKPFMPIALLVVGLATATQVSYSEERGLYEATLECQDGTCCPEAGSTCVVGQYQRPDKYYKSTGSCATAQT